MKLINEIFYIDKRELDGNTIERKAVKAVCFKQNELLLIHSKQNGDYKFPGGGIEKDESNIEALRRELMEEYGVIDFEITDSVGSIIEYSKAVDHGFDVFKMTSYYYLCNVLDMKSDLVDLDDYEEKLGFNPKWINIEEAIKKNSDLLKGDGDLPSWLYRETMMMNFVRNFE